MQPKTLFRVALGAVLAVGVGLAADAQATTKKKAMQSAPAEMAALTDQKGDPAKGKVAIIKKGNCLACHQMPIPEEADHGLIGPPLAGVASRLSAGEIRLKLVNPQATNSDSIMPPMYKTEGLNRVEKKFVGKTILDKQEVEDVVAYLSTLK